MKFGAYDSYFQHTVAYRHGAKPENGGAQDPVLPCPLCPLTSGLLLDAPPHRNPAPFPPTPAGRSRPALPGLPSGRRRAMCPRLRWCVVLLLLAGLSPGRVALRSRCRGGRCRRSRGGLTAQLSGDPDQDGDAGLAGAARGGAEGGAGEGAEGPAPAAQDGVMGTGTLIGLVQLGAQPRGATTGIARTFARQFLRRYSLDFGEDAVASAVPVVEKHPLSDALRDQFDELRRGACAASSENAWVRSEMNSGV